MHILTVLVLFVIGAAVCDDETTRRPETSHGKYTKLKQGQDSRHGIPRDHAPDDYTQGRNPFGRVLTEPIHHPYQPPPIISSPPNSKTDANLRSIGGVAASSLGQRPIDLYGSRDLGERRDIEIFRSPYQNYERIGGIPAQGHTDEFIQNYGGLVNPDEPMLAADIGVDSTPCTCQESEFLCPKSCECVHKSVRCDSTPDCSNGEDENDCQAAHEEFVATRKTECDSLHRVMCPRTYVCILPEWLCDGDDDCGDYSDETQCGASKNCSEDQYECQNGLCIQQSWVCDGDNDCKDFTDEVNCTKLTCTPEEFSCNDGSCVSLSFQCDSDVDCPDGSDEKNCETPMSNCPEGEFKCKGSVGGNTGPGGRCVLLRFRCDGDNDCGDWSDEEGCPRKPASCTSNEFKCDDGSCIPNRWRCDRDQDCDGGEDEKNCTGDVPGKEIGGRECVADEYTCKDNRCILKSWMCDGVADCKNGEDELECDAVCELGQFACPVHKNSSSSKNCIHQKLVCDGLSDCPGGEDELNCAFKHNCTANTKCEQHCVTFANGREGCSCRIGFTLHPNGYNCTDIDECQFSSDPVCSQKCYNTIGSFTCGCADSYILRPDLRTCKALGGAMKLIMANRAYIRQVSLSNNKYTSILKGLHNAIALDYHYKKSIIFWSDVSTDVIKASYINGTGIRDVIKWGLESPGGIAVDWIHDLLFWTDSGTRRVEVATFDGHLRAVIAANDLDKPRAIIAHPGEALILWTDWGPNPKIERSYMDGSDRRTLVRDGVFWPNGLAIDYPANRIYWADAKHHVIESANLEGLDRKKVLSNHLPHPFALTLFEDSMYWTDWHTKAISTANKITGKGYKFIHEGLNFPMDIHSYHPARQPYFNSRCAIDRRGLRGGCSHLCLPNKNSRRCACPIGLTLQDDQRTCTSVPDKILLIARKKDIRLRQLNPKNASTEIDMVVPLDGLKSTVALDWCSKNDYIYWTDTGRGAISRAKLNGSNQETIIHVNLNRPIGLAFDWVTNKLYFTDSGNNRIEVASSDGKQRALLIWHKLDEPRDIVVNPIEGIMFWSNFGKVPSIERAEMDGSQRKSIVTKNLMYPRGLAVDSVTNNRLYFIDSGTRVIEYVNFDGTGRTKLLSLGASSPDTEFPLGIDIFDNKIFWTNEGNIMMADKTTGKNPKALMSNFTDLMDLRVFHRIRKDVRNACNFQNGGCSHMCLLNAHGYTCSCPIGVILSADNRNCNSGPSNYILFSHRIDIRQISLDIDYMIDVVLPLPSISNAVALDIDLKTGDFYWSDTTEDVIMKSSSDGTVTSKIINESIDSIDGIAIDSVGRKIYWTDVGRHTIEVSELDGSHRKAIIWQDLESPRGIAVSYETGYLFWTDWGSHPKIERAEMDGSRRSKLVTSTLGWPNGLSVDSIQKRIYWTDAQFKHIQSCDFDGNYRRVEISDLKHPYGLAIGRETIYWTDWKTTSLHVANKTNTSSKRIIKNNLEGLMDVKIVEQINELAENACGTNNGGCSHLCLRNSRGFTCQCPTGTKLMPTSNTECELIPNNFLLVALRSGIGRISLDTQEFFDVVLPIPNIHGVVVLDYHFNQSKIIYADVNVDTITVVDMRNLTDIKTIISTGINTPNGIAVDWVADNFYWTDSGNRIMEVAKLDGSARKVILREGLNDPRSMIVYPKYGFIYWCDWGKQPRIERCLMDGSSRKLIIDSNLGYPTGLAIDFEFDKIYFADALQDRIDYCDLDGQNRHIVLQQATHPFGLTLFGPYIYWTDWYNKSVFRVNKNGAGAEEVRHRLRGALEIRSVSPDRQSDNWNSCAEQNGGCTHFCFFKGDSYTCGCPDKADDRPCKTEPAFIVAVKRPGYLERSTISPIVGAGVDNQSVISPEFILYTTIILGVILILVVIAILVLVFNSRKKRGRKSSRTSSGSILTFTNPNYNVAEGSGHSDSSKGTIWRRFKYDKGQDRVYEEKSLGGNEMASTNLMAATPSPMPSPSGPLSLSTIG